MLAKAVWVVVGFQVARYLGEVRLGDYTYTMAYVVPFEAIATLGLQFLLQREIAARPSEASELLGGALALWNRAAIGCPVFLVLLSRLLAEPAEVTRGLVIAGVGLLLWGAGSLHNAVLQAQEQLARAAAIEASSTLLRSLLCIGIVAVRGPMLWLFAAYTLSNAVFYALSYAWCPVRGRRPLGADLTPLLSRALPFAAMVLASGLYFRADVWVLKRLAGSAATGAYQAAYGPVNEVMTLGQLVAWSFYPRMVALFEGDPIGYRRLTRRALGVTLAIGVACAAIGSGLSSPLIHLCYQGTFDGSAQFLRLVALGVAFYLPASALTYAIVASGRTWFWTALLGGKAALSIALNLLLVPEWGARGTATTMLACEVAGLAMCLAAWILLPRRSGGR